MAENIVYYFSGTGNCLQVAQKIALALGSCDVICMANKNNVKLIGEYKSIGFVYPTYFQGIPNVVNSFVSSLDLSEQKETYIYAVTTYGEFVGNGLKQMKQLLAKKQVTLHYGAKLVMFSNYIVFYKMSKDVEEITQKSTRELQPIVQSICNKEKNADTIQKENFVLSKYNQWWMKRVSIIDKYFTVSSACIACGICEKVCPVQNITLENGIPRFGHTCEQCVACIQYCPKQAINYRNKTQNRGRYTNPSITWKDLAEANKL